MLLSIVIISRNEEQHIGKCIESCLEAVESIESEVILVDSASTDRTIEKAKVYPITIIQLRPEWPLSAAAGRYTGFLHAKGKYIQFQDGDSVLCKDWFKNSIPFLEGHKDIAGVVGIITQEDYDTKESRWWIESSKPENIRFGEIEYFSGDSLLRKDVLLDVGPFNPFLKAIEEGELCDRLKYRGDKLEILNFKMSHHYGYEDGFFGMLNRRKISSIAGGQIFRSSLKNKHIYLWRLKEYQYIFYMTILMVFLLPTIGLKVVMNNNIPLYIWIFSLLMIFISIIFKKVDLIVSVRFFLSIVLRWPYFLKGFLMQPKDSNDYPSDVKIIKIERNI